MVLRFTAVADFHMGGCLSGKQKNPKNGPTSSFNNEARFTARDMVGKRKQDFYNEYIYVRDLGHGTFGEVVEAKHKNTKISRAVKMLLHENMTVAEKEDIFKEIEILRQLDHPNIMKIFEYFENKDHIFIVGELYTGGELFEKIVLQRRFTEKDAANVMKQILLAVNYCHKKGIVHRDLKPQNILYESKDPNSAIKLVDFGVSAVIEPNKNFSRATGTPLFMAPEVLKKDYNEKCDIWSCGVILYMLLSGEIPFKGRTKQAILSQIASGTYDFLGKEWDHVSQKAKNFVKKLMTFNPNDRLSAEEALMDSWITDTIKEEKDLVLAENALNGLRTYRAEKKLQEAFWTFISSYFARNDEKNEFLKVFKALDTNGDGTLSKDELLKGFKEVAPFGYKEEDIDQIMKAADSNGNGVIDYSEFVAATIQRRAIMENNRLEEIFKYFDKDGSGAITMDEIKELFNPGQKNIDDKKWKALLKEIDQNGDQEISYAEFKELISRIVNSGLEEEKVAKKA